MGIAVPYQSFLFIPAFRAGTFAPLLAALSGVAGSASLPLTMHTTSPAKSAVVTPIDLIPRARILISVHHLFCSVMLQDKIFCMAANPQLQILFVPVSDAHGPMLAGDVLIVSSGYGSFLQEGGNALLVFSLAD